MSHLWYSNGHNHGKQQSGVVERLSSTGISAWADGIAFIWNVHRRKTDRQALTRIDSVLQLSFLSLAFSAKDSGLSNLASVVHSPNTLPMSCSAGNPCCTCEERPGWNLIRSNGSGGAVFSLALRFSRSCSAANSGLEPPLSFLSFFPYCRCTEAVRFYLATIVYDVSEEM